MKRVLAIIGILTAGAVCGVAQGNPPPALLYTISGGALTLAPASGQAAPGGNPPAMLCETLTNTGQLQYCSFSGGGGSGTVGSGNGGQLAHYPSTGTTVGGVTYYDYQRYVAAKCQSGAAGLAFSSPLGSSPTPVCDSATASPAANGVISGYAEFTATSQSIQDHFTLSSTWTGAIDISGVFRNSATSGNVVWDIQTGCVAAAALLDPTFNTANSITVASQGTAYQMNTFSSTGITTTGCAAGDELFWKLNLDSSSTVTLGTIDLVGVVFTVRRTI